MYYHWTSDSNGYRYCTGCGKGDREHPALNCRIPADQRQRCDLDPESRATCPFTYPHFHNL